MKNEFKESYKYWKNFTHGKIMAFFDGLLLYFMKLINYIENKLIKPIEKEKNINYIDAVGYSWDDYYKALNLE